MSGISEVEKGAVNQPRAPKGSPDGGQWIKAGGGFGSIGDASHEDGHVYHVTTRDSIHDIAQSGLDLFDPSYGSEQDSWPDGSVDPRSYWGETPKAVEPFSRPGAVLLRARRTQAHARERGTPDIYTTSPTPSSALEVFGDDGKWHPVGELVEKYDPNQPRNPKGSPDGGRWKGKAGAATTESSRDEGPPWIAFERELGVKTKQISPSVSQSVLDTPKGEAVLRIDNTGPATIKIHWLLAEKRGAGRAAMERITQVADKHGVTLALWAQPLPGQGENEGLLLTKPRLEAFYRDFGFKTTRTQNGTSWMERSPARSVEKYDPNQPRAPKGSPDGGKWIGTRQVRSSTQGKKSAASDAVTSTVKAAAKDLVARFPIVGKTGTTFAVVRESKLTMSPPETMRGVAGIFVHKYNAIELFAGTLGRIRASQPSPKIGGFCVDESIAGATRHEYGHAVMSMFLRDRKLAEVKAWGRVNTDLYLRLGRKTPGFYGYRKRVSKYAATNEDEFFAEAFSAYTHPKYKRGSLDAEIETFMDTYVAGKVRKSEVDVERIAQIADAIDDGESIGKFSRETADDMRATLAKRAPEHSGIFVALWLEPDAARKLAVPDGERAEELHVTLAYGDGNLARAMWALRELIPSLQPLRGLVRETDTFEPTESSEGKPVQYGVVDVPGLRDLQAEVMSVLRSNGFTERTPREYKPHITLRYGAEPVKLSEPVPLELRRISIGRGDVREIIPLGIGKRGADGTPQERWPAGHPWAPTGDGPGRFKPKAVGSYGSKAGEVMRHTGPPTIVVSLTPSREKATDKPMRGNHDDEITKESGGKLGEAIVIEALRSHLAKRAYVAEVTSTLEDIGHVSEAHERAIPAPKDPAVAREVRGWKEWEAVQAHASRKKTATDSARNNAPVDVIAGDELIEVKAGPWSNTEASQRWRVSEGAIGKAEAALRNRMSKKIASLTKQHKAAEEAHGKHSSKALNLKIKLNTWRAEKASRGAVAIVRAMERKKRFVDVMSNVSGRKMKYRAINVIFNHDTKTADLFATSYASKEIRWSQRGDLQYLGSFKYTVKGRYKVRGGEYKRTNLKGDKEVSKIAKYILPPMPDEIEIDEGGDDPYTEQLVADLSDGVATYEDFMAFEDADALMAEDEAIYAEDARMARALWDALKDQA